jgi:1-acyl-sn-glycerol-3-phosphate acyltransferase
MWHWFGEVAINGKENIPYRKPCILLPCHQNGLIDCVTLLAEFEQPITFFAKSALFVNGSVCKIFAFLRIMPAYRQREGFQNVTKNEENFRKAVDLLLRGYPFCIMPEGGQHEEHRLHAFVKGPFRIAFHTQEKLPCGETVYLLPVGLDYGHYDRIGYPFVLNIGKPIRVDEYMDLYYQHEGRALNAIKEDAFNELSSNMLDIRSQEYYAVFYLAAYLYNYRMLQQLNLPDNLSNRLKARQKIVGLLDDIALAEPQKLENLVSKGNDYLKNNPDFVTFSNSYPKEKWHEVLCFLLVLCPIFIYGLAINFLLTPFILAINPKLKESGFSATIKYVSILILSPVNHLIMALIFGVSTSWWLTAFLIVLTGMPITVFMGKYIRKIRIFRQLCLSKKHKEQIKAIQAELAALFAAVR